MHAKYAIKPIKHYVDGLVQYCSSSSALTMEVLQSYTKQSMWECPTPIQQQADNFSFEQIRLSHFRIMISSLVMWRL